MIDFNIGQPIKSATLEATIIRKDGRREPLGVLAAYHRDPLGFKRLVKRLGGRIGRIHFRGA